MRAKLLADNATLALAIPMSDKIVHVTSLQLVRPAPGETKLPHAGQLVEWRLLK